MNTAEKIVEELEKMLEAAEVDVEACWEEMDIWYAKGIKAALNKAMAIAKGFH